MTIPVFDEDTGEVSLWFNGQRVTGYVKLLLNLSSYIDPVDLSDTIASLYHLLCVPRVLVVHGLDTVASLKREQHSLVAVTHSTRKLHCDWFRGTLQADQQLLATVSGMSSRRKTQ